MYTTKTRITENETVSVRSVPADSLTKFFFISDPAMANWMTMERYRPKNMARPAVIFQKQVLSARPSKPEPLLAAEQAYSYSTWLRP